MCSIAVLRALSSGFHHGFGLAPGFLIGILALAASTSASVNSDAAWSSSLVVEVVPASRIPSCSSQEGAKLLNSMELSVLNSARFVHKKVKNRS